MVFSAEHYAPIVHNWVCWAAPVRRPGHRSPSWASIDLSTTWDRTHPIGLATARVLARLIETAMPHTTASRSVLAGRRADPRPGADAARQRRGAPGRAAAAAQPAADRGARAARPAPRGAVPRAAARRGVRRPVGHPVDAEGRGLPPALGPRRASSPHAPTGSRSPWPPTSTRSSGCCAAARWRAAVAAYGGDLLPGTNSPALGRVRRVRRGRGPRGPARRSRAHGRAPLHRARAVRHRGASRSAWPPSAPPRTRPSPCSRAGWPLPAAERPPTAGPGRRRPEGHGRRPGSDGHPSPSSPPGRPHRSSPELRSPKPRSPAQSATTHAANLAPTWTL